MKIVREEGGIRALYRGLVTTAVGVAPYVGLNFASYEALRGIITPPGKTSIPRKLACGALAGTCVVVSWCQIQMETLSAGSISQTVTYPFDVLRRKMQVTGMKDGSVKYSGALDALRSILRTEGVAGLYRGLWPNLRK
jgi:solute carrier family 25 (mitochondrial phosphate transporter), member 23/24/25/41